MDDDFSENENYVSNNYLQNKKNMNSSLEQKSTEANNTNGIQNKINNFDDIPIKPSTNNFLELLEKNLENDEYQNYNEDTIKPSSNRINKYQPRKRKEININYNAPTKKFKYYAENFNKKFNSENSESPTPAMLPNVDAKANKNKKPSQIKYEKQKNSSNAFAGGTNPSNNMSKPSAKDSRKDNQIPINNNRDQYNTNPKSIFFSFLFF